MGVFIIRFRWLAMLCLGFYFQLAAPGQSLVSSPEGTLTKYVRDGGVQVYAPRAARAQKVVFDTPEKQLIYEPDTPFRSFFDSHSDDFSPGKVDYAKTTILGDIVNLLRNKEYIRLMIQEVVSRHEQTAIKDQAPCEGKELIKRLQDSLGSAVLGFSPNSDSVRAFDSDLNAYDYPVIDLSSQKEEIDQLVLRLRDGTVSHNAAAASLSNSFAIILNEDAALKSNILTAINNSFTNLLVSTSFWSGEDLQPVVDAMERSTINTDIIDANLEALISLLNASGFLIQQPSVDNYNEIEAAGIISRIITNRKESKEALQEIKNSFLDLELRIQALSTNSIKQLRDSIASAYATAARQAITNKIRLFHLLSQPPNIDNPPDFNLANIPDNLSISDVPLQTSQLRTNLLILSDLSKLSEDDKNLLRRLSRLKSSTVAADKILGNLFEKILLLDAELAEMNAGDAVQAITLLQNRTDKNWELSAQALNAIKNLANRGDYSIEVDLLSIRRSLDLYRSPDRKIIEDEILKLLEKLREWKASRSEFARILGKTFQVLDELCDDEKSSGTAASAKGESVWMTRRSELLTDHIYLRFVTEGYPDIRDDRILEILEDIAGISPYRNQTKPTAAWEYATGKNRLVAKEALRLDLEQNLTERSYFEKVIEQAVNKRKELFRTRGAALESVGAARQAVEEFARKNLFEPEYFAAFTAGRDSLWSTFLHKLNSGPDQDRVLRRSGADLPLSEDALSTVFGNALRARLKESLPVGKESGPVIKQAFLAFFKADTNQSPLLNPKFASEGDPFDRERELWLKQLSSFDKVKSSLKSLEGLFADTNLTNASSPPYLESRTNLVVALLAATDAIWQLRPTEANLAFPPVEELKSGFREKLVTAADAQIKKAPDQRSVGGLLKAALGEKFSADVSPAFRKLLSLFEATFTGHFALVHSDLPMLSAVLHHSSLFFPDASKKQETIKTTAQAFSERWKLGQEPARDKMSEELKTIFDLPKVVASFLHTAPNEGVIESFKEEFYNAFKHRLPEALEAEREADYDYWWVTFYPKAIPLGSKKLAGESIIEIGFPERIVPEEQYHRYLQDRVLFGTSALQRVASTLEAQRLYHATTVLRDFQSVLDGSELAVEYRDLRQQLHEAHRAFSVGKNGEQNFEAGMAALGRNAEKVARGATTKPLSWVRVFLEYKNAWEACSKPGNSQPEQPPKVESLRLQLRQELAKTEANLASVYLAVTSAVDNASSLPEKINLYSYAHFKGVGVGEQAASPTDAAFSAFAANILFLDPFDREDTALNQLKEDAVKAGENLRQIVVNAYFSTYPGIPNRKDFRAAFFADPANVRGCIMLWCRQLLGKSGTAFRTNQQKNFVTRRLDDFRFLTKDAQSKLIQITRAASTNTTNFTARICLMSLDDPVLFDQLYNGVFEVYFASFFRALSLLEKTERHALAYQNIKPNDYSGFQSWAKPQFQPGIQIVEVLPSSRDDLVAMSISEAGVTAKVAAQASASAAYDINKLAMAARTLDGLMNSQNTATTPEKEETVDGVVRKLSAKETKLEELSSLSDIASSLGYTAGASAKGSIYAKANAALAYSKRREYLNAAITAAGRGDNFAKWVIRQADLRSTVAGTNAKKLVAAAHNGYPNGDQPFHLLVKIPRASCYFDSAGKPSIFFNSAYVATKRTSLFKDIGYLGLAAKAPLFVINPHWWTAIEQDAVGTVFPFKWEVSSRFEQSSLLREANSLGGSIWLDEMDKIKYSEILTLLGAEEEFIKTTRTFQSSEVQNLLSTLEPEAKTFDARLQEEMKQRRLLMDQLRNENKLQPPAPQPQPESPKP